MFFFKKDKKKLFLLSVPFPTWETNKQKLVKEKKKRSLFSDISIITCLQHNISSFLKIGKMQMH